MNIVVLCDESLAYLLRKDNWVGGESTMSSGGGNLWVPVIALELAAIADVVIYPTNIFFVSVPRNSDHVSGKAIPKWNTLNVKNKWIWGVQGVHFII